MNSILQTAENQHAVQGSVATDSKNRDGTSSRRAVSVWCAMPNRRALRAWPAVGMGGGDFSRKPGCGCNAQGPRTYTKPQVMYCDFTKLVAT